MKNQRTPLHFILHPSSFILQSFPSQKLNLIIDQIHLRTRRMKSTSLLNAPST